MLNTSKSPKQIFDAYLYAFARRSVQEIEPLFAENAVFDLPFHKGRVSGRASIISEIKTALMGLDSIRISIDHLLEDGNSIFAEGAFFSEPIAFPPFVDGTPFRLDFKFVVVVETNAGLITRWSEYFDTKPLMPRERTRIYPITRRSPYWDGSVKAGVSEFMIYNHTYFPLVYDHTPAEEYVALTERVTLWDVGCEKQTQLKGPDAVQFAQFLTTRDLSKLKPGHCKYTLCCDPLGKIICDPVLIHPYEDTVWLSHGDADLTLWAQGIAMFADYDVEVSEPDVAPIQIQGPNSIDVLRGLVETPLDDLGFYKCMPNRVAGIDAIVSRTGWSGGLGYEIFPLSSDRAMTLWEAVMKAGERYGIMVIGPNVFRAVEKGVTDTAYYSNSNMDPYEAGHGRLVDLEKGDFVGRDALRRAADEPLRRKTVGLLIEGQLPLLEWYWPLIDKNSNSGEVRWATHSFGLNRSIGIAIVDAALQIGDTVTVYHPLGNPNAIVTEIPFI